MAGTSYPREPTPLVRVRFDKTSLMLSECELLEASGLPVMGMTLVADQVSHEGVPFLRLDIPLDYVEVVP